MITSLNTCQEMAGGTFMTDKAVFCFKDLVDQIRGSAHDGELSSEETVNLLLDGIEDLVYKDKLDPKDAIRILCKVTKRGYMLPEDNSVATTSDEQKPRRRSDGSNFVPPPYCVSVGSEIDTLT